MTEALWVERETLVRRANALRELGVQVPRAYPPANLDRAAEHLHTELGALEVAEALASTTNPALLGIEPAAYKGRGDVDLMIAGSPAVLVQTKTLSAASIQKGGKRNLLLGMIRQAKQQIAIEIQHAPLDSRLWLARMTGFSKDRSPSLELQSTPATGAKGLHVLRLEVTAETLGELLRPKVRKALSQAAKQLRAASTGDEFLVPCLSVATFPHDAGPLVETCRQALRGMAEIAGCLILDGPIEPRPGKATAGQVRALYLVPNPKLPAQGNTISARLGVAMEPPRRSPQNLVSWDVLVDERAGPIEPIRLQFRGSEVWANRALFATVEEAMRFGAGALVGYQSADGSPPHLRFETD